MIIEIFLPYFLLLLIHFFFSFFPAPQSKMTLALPSHGGAANTNKPYHFADFSLFPDRFTPGVTPEPCAESDLEGFGESNNNNNNNIAVPRISLSRSMDPEGGFGGLSQSLGGQISKYNVRLR